MEISKKYDARWEEERKEREAYYNRYHNLRKLGFSSRASNAAADLGVEKISDFNKIKYERFLNMNHVGRKTIEEMADLLVKNGIYLQSEPSNDREECERAYKVFMEISKNKMLLEMVESILTVHRANKNKQSSE